jgi:hypothetical protein
MKNEIYLDQLLAGNAFRFARLHIDGIDNESVLRQNAPEMAKEEICLFHRDFSSGNQYMDRLHSLVEKSINAKKPFPVVRFADGEFAFYRYSLKCNGLYQQAESAAAIRRVMPAHIEAIRSVARHGQIAPLVFPGNTHRNKMRLFSFLRKSGRDDSAIRFLDFIAANGIELTADNYIPFYVVYAYLATERFARMLDGKSVCIVNAAYDKHAFRTWFEAFSSAPRFHHISIPASYVATRWNASRSAVFSNIPDDIDLCLIGAGIGALQITADIAEHFSVPAFDAGHIMNMMNGRTDKSGGPRLYSLWKESRPQATPEDHRQSTVAAKKNDTK